MGFLIRQELFWLSLIMLLHYEYYLQRNLYQPDHHLTSLILRMSSRLYCAFCLLSGSYRNHYQPSLRYDSATFACRARRSSGRTPYSVIGSLLDFSLSSHAVKPYCPSRLSSSYFLGCQVSPLTLEALSNRRSFSEYCDWYLVMLCRMLPCHAAALTAPSAPILLIPFLLFCMKSMFVMLEVRPVSQSHWSKAWGYAWFTP